MNIFDASFLGVVEGLTEFLPISSTAHLILASKALSIDQSNFVKTFEIAIQFGAILSVVYFYWKDLFSKWMLYPKILSAFIPTSIIGFLLYKIIKDVFFESYALIIFSLILGGAALIMFELLHKDKPNETQEDITKLPYGKCMLIGLFQSISVIPGVSRSAATIIGGLAIGIKRKTIVEFSFLLAVPTMLSATVYDMAKSNLSFSQNELLPLSIGFVVSFFVALLSIKFLLNYIKKNNFVSFGIYRIIIGLIFMIIFLL